MVPETDVRPVATVIAADGGRVSSSQSVNTRVTRYSWAAATISDKSMEV